MIYTENEQSIIKADETLGKLVEDVAKKTLEYEHVDGEVDINVLYVDNDSIREINREQRNIDRETDVLSFPMLEFEDGKMITSEADFYEGALILGDIVLSLEKAKSQSEEYGHSFEREVGFLVCHSVLHLLGYDHETEEERSVMRQKEEAVLKLLNLTR